MKLVYNIDDKRNYAMKVMNKRRLKSKFMGIGKNAYHMVENELAILKQIDHPNCVNLIEIMDDEEGCDKIYLIMEYISRGNLKDKIDKEGLDKNQCRRYFRDIIAGLEYCHEIAGVVHRDIKPENVMIDENLSGKIVDFGVCFLMRDRTDDTITATAGTTLFFAPEMCMGEAFHGRATDVWAAGVTLWYMLFKSYPFYAKTVSKAYDVI